MKTITNDDFSIASFEPPKEDLISYALNQNIKINYVQNLKLLTEDN